MVENEQHIRERKEWYAHGWGLVAAILFFPYFIIWYAWAKSKWTKTVKIIVTAVIVVFLLPIFVGMATTTPETSSVNTSESNKVEANKTESAKREEVAKEKTPKETLREGILSLMKSKQAFDTGSYVKGDIPQGEYAFISFDGSGKYYSEEDSAGNIVDNENFDSFGYVYVHGVGNISTSGVLIATSSLSSLDATGAKDVYEKINETPGYKGSGMYKAGTDINPGQHTIQSIGSAYVAVLTGPVGNNDIVDNENFSGRHAVNVQNGQYLTITRGELVQ